VVSCALVKTVLLQQFSVMPNSTPLPILLLLTLIQALLLPVICLLLPTLTVLFQRLTIACKHNSSAFCTANPAILDRGRPKAEVLLSAETEIMPKVT